MKTLQDRLAQLYELGMQRMQRDRNYEYAHAVFADCVIHDPGNLRYVQSLLENLRNKVPSPRKRASLWGRGGSRELKHAVAEEKWPDAIRIAIDLLKNDPWDVVTLRALAEISAHFHHNEVELAYLKQALESDSKNLEVNRHCARSLARMGQFDQAIACWHRIETLRPGNKEAAQMIAQLSQEKLKYPKGRPQITQQPKEAIAHAPVKQLADEARVIELTPQQALEKAIRACPANPVNYLQLAELLADAERFKEAEDLVSRGIAACPVDARLNQCLERIASLRVRHDVLLAEARQREIDKRNRSFKIPWLELSLVLAGFVLVAQLIPTVGAFVRDVIDFRNWPYAAWLTANVVTVVVLCLICFWPRRAAQ